MTSDPRSEAIKAMGEVIAAQALHIEKLEAGHWSKHTRKRVDRAKRKLEEAVGLGPGPAGPWNLPADKGRPPMGKIPEEPRHIDAGEPLGDVGHKGEDFMHYQPLPTPWPTAHEHTFDKGGELRCHVRYGTNGERQCIFPAGHLWLHSWEILPKDETE